MSPYLWLAVVGLPVAATGVLAWKPTRIAPWLWLAPLPALLLAFFPVAPLAPALLWPAALWGSDDSLSRGWLGFSAVIWIAGGLAAADRQRSFRFWLFWLLALTGNLLLCMAQDGLSFYVGFSVMSLSAYGLIVHEGEPWRHRAGRLYMQLALSGEMLVFAGLALQVQSAQDMVTFGRWQNLSLDLPTVGLVFAGFAIKAGLWPLHSWMPLAYPAPPAAGAAVLAGAMTEAGILGIWRFLPAEHGVIHNWSGLFFALGLASVFFGVLMGLTSRLARSALAYSSISQMGYLLTVISLGWHSSRQIAAVTTLLLLFAAHHGVAKAALFLGSGAAGRIRFSGFHWMLLALPTLAISGLPLTSGGAVKTELEVLLEESGFAPFAGLFKLAALGTTVLLMRALWLIRQFNREPDCTERLSCRGWAGWLSLSLLPLIMPWFWPAFREILLRNLSWTAAWALSWPIGLGLLLSVVAVKARWRAPRHWPLRLNPAIRTSFYLKRLLQNPPLPRFKPEPDWTWWRQREREWNRFWGQQGTVSASVWLLSLVVLGGAVWSLAWG